MDQLSFEEIMDLELPPREYIETGTKIDLISKGFAKKEIHLISGASGEGKSLSMTHLALNSAIKGNKVYYLALENAQDDDIERIKDAARVYSNYLNEGIYDNFVYENLSEESNKRLKTSKIIESLSQYDIVFVDGTEYLISGKTPTEISDSGRVLMINLRAAAIKNNATIVMSWQINRLGTSKKLEELNIGDLSGSMSMSQQSYSIWLIRQYHEKTFKWKMRLLKCRAKRDFNIIDQFDVLDKSNEFNLHVDENNI